MAKKFLQNISEYRQWAWNVLEENDGNQNVADQLGLQPVYDCWDVNENGEEVDENGNVIPEDTAENVKLADFINELVFPVIAVYWIEKDHDRFGKVEIIAVDFVELKEFKKSC